MRGMLQGMQDCGTITLREIQLSGTVGGKIMADNVVDLRSERLDRD